MDKVNLKLLDDFSKQQSNLLEIGGTWFGTEPLVPPFFTARDQKRAKKILLANGFVLTSQFSATKVK